MKFLIVDDDEVLRGLLTLYVKKYGECDVANNGEAAFQMFVDSHTQNSPYDAILMDIQMPELDGHGALKKIRDWESEREISPYDGVKIVMITSHSDPSNILSSFKEGCEDYLVKPINEDKVTKLLEELDLT